MTEMGEKVDEMKAMRRLSGFVEKDNREVNNKHNYADDKEKDVFMHKLLPFVFSDSPYIDHQSQDSSSYIEVEKRHDFALDMPDNFTAMLKEPFRSMFGGMMRLMCYEVDKNGAKDSGSEKRKNSIDHVESIAHAHSLSRETRKNGTEARLLRPNLKNIFAEDRKAHLERCATNYFDNTSVSIQAAP